MSVEPYSILFLCTGNSARSVIAESVALKLGGNRLRPFSAGSQPVGRVNPRALEVLAAHGYPTCDLRSKSWLEFATAGALRMNFVITVCDSAAGEVCPIWPGRPATAHWGMQDPAAVDGSETEQRKAFEWALKELEAKISAFLALPNDEASEPQIARHLSDIGSMFVKREPAET